MSFKTCVFDSHAIDLFDIRIQLDFMSLYITLTQNSVSARNYGQEEQGFVGPITD